MENLIRILIIGSAALLGTRVSQAEESFFFFEAGGMLSNMNKVTAKEDASPSFTGTKQLVFGLSVKMGAFKPGLDYTLFGYGGPDETYTSKTLVLELPYMFFLSDDSGPELKAGITAWRTTLAGKGGNVTLPNGTSTATFSRPGRSESTLNLGFVFGLHQPMTEEFFLDLDAHILAPLSSRRTLNLLAQLSWRFY